jgi:hypothetical protein
MGKTSFDYKKAGLQRKLLLSRDIHKYSRTLMFKPKVFVINGVQLDEQPNLEKLDW